MCIRARYGEGETRQSSTAADVGHTGTLPKKLRNDSAIQDVAIPQSGNFTRAKQTAFNSGGCQVLDESFS
ncbi:hypothetical protein GCM10027403_35170 [Arthrobacter tecti]